MSLLTTIPGDIPGLLQQWSPLVIWVDIIARHVKGTLRDTRPMIDGRLKVYAADDLCAVNAAPPEHIALDLTAPTGRGHAAWWAMTQIGFDGLDQEVLRLAVCGCDITPKQIDALARLVLRLAGREAP